MSLDYSLCLLAVFGPMECQSLSKEHPNVGSVSETDLKQGVYLFKLKKELGFMEEDLLCRTLTPNSSPKIPYS